MAGNSAVVAAGALLALGALLAPRAGAAPVLVERTVVAMGTTLEGRVWAESREDGFAALEAAFRAVDREERLLSTWRGDTELSRLNRAEPGRPVDVSRDLLGLLEEVWDLSAATGGSFDPVVGALVDAWDLRGDGRRPGPEELGAALEASGRRCFRLDPARRRVVRRCPGAWIDAGGFGKGSALRDARRALDRPAVEAALLDFGGQLLAVGAPPGREAWPAAVAHPSRRSEALVRLRLADRSAATTSASERGVVVDGVTRGHVLDPRSGRPAPGGRSVTVVAEDPLEADVLSTALFVLGPEEAWARTRARNDVGVLFLYRRPAEGAEDGTVACWNPALAHFLAEVPVARECPGAEAADEPRRETGGET